jgi:hypothetical protein
MFVTKAIALRDGELYLHSWRCRRAFLRLLVKKFVDLVLGFVDKGLLVWIVGMSTVFVLVNVATSTALETYQHMTVVRKLQRQRTPVW